MGFTPLAATSRPSRGFTPLQPAPVAEQPGVFAPAVETLKDIGRVYPVIEAAGNLASQAVALPVAGVAGLGAAASQALGLTDANPAEVVHQVGGALTYQPHTAAGQHFTETASYPFRKLAEAGQYAGDKTLDATGSPVLATAADTAVNALPMAFGKPARSKGPLELAADRAPRPEAPVMPEPVARMPEAQAHSVTTTASAPLRNAQEATAPADAHSPLVAGDEAPNRYAGSQHGSHQMGEGESALRTSTQDEVRNLVRTETTSERHGFTPLDEGAANVSDHGLDTIKSAQEAVASTDAGIPIAARDEVPTVRVEDGGAPNEVRGETVRQGFKPLEQAAAAEPNVAMTEPVAPKSDRYAPASAREAETIQAEAMPAAEMRQMYARDTDMRATDPAMDAQRVIDPAGQGEAALMDTPSPVPIAATEVPRLLGKRVTEHTDARLREVLTSDSFAPALKLRAREELARRGASSEQITSPIESVMPDAPVDSRAAWAPGANYAGFVDNAKTGGQLAEKPIRREDVLIPLLKDLGIRMYEGRVTGKRLGFYIPKMGAVRIKNKSDMEVAAHEIAHALDDRIPEIRASWLKGDMAKVHADELRGVSYDKTKLFEGFAEFTRLYMTQPERAKAAAPNYYKWFDAFTQRHPNGAAIRKAQEGMTGWFNQDALHRAQSKIGMQRSINEALDGFGDRFRQAVVDDLHGVYRMERQLTGKTAPLGAYETARLTRGAGGLVDGAIRLGAPIRKADGAFDFQGKGLEKILEPVADNLNHFLMYAVGRSSHELMMQGREKLFSQAEVRAMLQLKRPEFEAAFAEYQAWNKGVLDFAESMGVINKKARSMWQRSQYLPYYRVGQAGAAASKGGAQGNWAGIQKLTGGTGNLRDILGNMTQNAATLIDTALKNEARAKIVRLAETEKGGGNFLVKIAPDSKLVKIEREQIKDKLLEAAGINPRAARSGILDAEQAKMVAQIEQQMENAPGLFEVMVHNQTPKGNIMAVLEDGKPTYYEVADPLLYRAVASFNRAPQHWLVRLLGLPKRIGQMTITLTPDFMVANIARDTIMGAVMSRAGFRPIVDSLKGMESRIKQDSSYREYLANGGGFASYLSDEATFRAHLDRFYTSRGFNPKTVLDAPDKVMYFMETLADAFEMSTRLGEYKRLRAQGMQPREAAYLGREISTDFAMNGDSQVLGALYDTVMFLRPAVVSLDRVYRGLAHDPNKGAIAAKAGTIALLSAWLHWQNKDNPRYDELEDWDKDSYWHFFVQVDGKEEHFRYPKIWEVGALASVAERSVAALNDQEPEYGKAVGRILGNLFNLNMMPQVVAPLYEQAMNRNGFTKAPIETPGMENMQPFLRAKPTTSETLKAVGMASRDLPEGLQVNPVRAEALLRGYFNTWAMYGLMLSDQAFFGDALPEMRADEMPVMRRFSEGNPVKHNKYETMFYDMLGEAKRLHGTMRELDATNRSAIADEIEKAPLSSKGKQLERASQSVSTINADMEEVRRDTMLTPAGKRAKLDALIAEKNALLKDTVLEVKGLGDAGR